MQIIGLCGGIGSGKSYVADTFAEMNIPYINTDAVYKELCVAGSEMLVKIEKAFGTDVIDENGNLNRKNLAAVVFADRAKLDTLNSITHPSVIEETERRVRALELSGKKSVLIEVPLMFESKFNKRCDHVVAVVCNREKRIARIIRRDKCTEEEAIARIEKQHDDDFFIENSDYVICNDGIADIKEQVIDCIKFFNIQA
ncbi:MAG: dephospho-CoA kinase [Ruminococcaceae bacterium]|nr:dephospho-CoA kinase [Oscillospiraceae bacterium]